ncbi:MAG TPA: rhomboid family intramembrane serine protease, partial [Verrucomicrobiae bacterium]|nr:rhomboid family intramembrane serine protease [Verrucomicrobiae bacterium]
IGRPRFIAFYLMCGLASEFTYIAMAPGHFTSEIPLGGASGAISGCIGAFLLLFLRTKIEFKWVIFFFFRLWSGEFFMPAWLVISFWFLKDFAGMVVSMTTSETGGGVAFAAHVGGTLCGLGLMAVQKALLKMPSLDEETEEEVEAQPVPQPLIRPAREPIRVQLNAVRARVIDPAAIYLFQANAQTGPFTSAQVQDMFRQGGIPLDALYWQEGMDDWRSAEELRPPGTA